MEDLLKPAYLSLSTPFLIMDDPDVPKSIREDGMWDHWIVFNIAIKGLETLKIEEEEEPDGICGKGTAGNLKYYPPCPPDTEHRYVFKAYTLSDELSLPEGSIKKEVEKAMEGKIIDKAELVGLYERK